MSYHANISFETPVDQVWLVGLATVSTESFAAVEAQSMHSIVYRPIEQGGIVDPLETGERIWKNFYRARTVTRLRRHAEDLKHLLGASGNVSYTAAGKDEQGCTSNEHVSAIEALSSSSFGDIQYKTDGRYMQFDCLLKAGGISNTSDLGNILRMGKFEHPDSRILKSFKDTQIEWYFLVELRQPLQGNATGVREHGGGNGKKYELVLLNGEGGKGDGLYHAERSPKIILHYGQISRESVFINLRRWKRAYSIWDSLEDQLDRELNISGKKYDDLISLLTPIKWYCPIRRIAAAQTLASLQIYVLGNQNSLKNLAAFKGWLEVKWKDGSLDKNECRIFVGEFIHDRQIALYDTNPLDEAFETASQSALNKAESLDGQVARIHAAVGPIASSYQTQSSTAAEMIGVVSALVAVVALGLAGWQFYSATHDVSKNLNTAAACSQISRTQQRGFPECVKYVR